MYLYCISFGRNLLNKFLLEKLKETRASVSEKTTAVFTICLAHTHRIRKSRLVEWEYGVRANYWIIGRVNFPFEIHSSRSSRVARYYTISHETRPIISFTRSSMTSFSIDQCCKNLRLSQNCALHKIIANVYECEIKHTNVRLVNNIRDNECRCRFVDCTL